MKDYLSKPEINFFIPILAYAVGIAITFGVLSTRLTVVEATTNKLQSQVEEQVKTNEQIKVSLARIETDIVYIRQGLDKHLSN